MEVAMQSRSNQILGLWIFILLLSFAGSFTLLQGWVTDNGGVLIFGAALLAPISVNLRSLKDIADHSSGYYNSRIEILMISSLVGIFLSGAPFLLWKYVPPTRGVGIVDALILISDLAFAWQHGTWRRKNFYKIAP